MPTEFYKDTDWEGSSGPILPRMVDAAALWPHGVASESPNGDKDVLADGLHPVLALGVVANRPNNLTGVVMKFTTAHLVTLNMADKVIVRNYVANITSYGGGGGHPPNYSATYPAMAPVYVDDSHDLTDGVTLSMSPLNEAGAGNPLAGYIFYCQDEYLDGDIGGPNILTVFPKAASVPASLSEDILCILLVNDSGQSRALITE